MPIVEAKHWSKYGVWRAGRRGPTDNTLWRQSPWVQILVKARYQA